MNLQNFEVKTVVKPVGATGLPSEDKAGRINRMSQFWANPTNAILWTVGKLLSVEVQGKSLAERLIAGEEFEMNALTMNGRVLPLQDGFKLSLKTLAVWGCPACRSAHGSGVAPSREKKVHLLVDCKFFYNPATKQLFTISDTCWKDYVKDLGAATPQRFTPVPEAPKADKGQPKAKVA